MCNTFTLKNEDGLSFVKEAEDRIKIRTVEMAKLDVNKPLEQISAYCSLNVDEIELLIKS